MGSSPYEGVLPNVISSQSLRKSSLLVEDQAEVKRGVLTDDEAIGSIQNGNVEALGLIFDRYYRSVYSIGLRILRNATEAQELVQDVFLHICEKAHLYRPYGNGSFSSWLHHVAYTCAFNRKEYLNVRHFYDHLEIVELTSSADSEISIETQAEILQWNKILNDALSDLDERQRQTLQKFFYEGYSLREISTQLDESLGNTRNHYYRGIQKLRALLKSHLRSHETRNTI